jgi:hypothetical protein
VKDRTTIGETRGACALRNFETQLPNIDPCNHCSAAPELHVSVVLHFKLRLIKANLRIAQTIVKQDLNCENKDDVAPGQTQFGRSAPALGRIGEGLLGERVNPKIAAFRDSTILWLIARALFGRCSL